jgi:hypothetical protein
MKCPAKTRQAQRKNRKPVRNETKAKILARNSAVTLVLDVIREHTQNGNSHRQGDCGNTSLRRDCRDEQLPASDK